MEKGVCYMQQIFEVKDTAAHNQKASQCCTCWKGDTVCCSLCRGAVLGVILTAVVQLISRAACVCLLGTRVQVFSKSMTGMMCDWISCLPWTQRGCSSMASSVFISLGSLWFTEMRKAASEVWNDLYDGPFHLSSYVVSGALLERSR